jgi:hypothetical protein
VPTTLLATPTLQSSSAPPPLGWLAGWRALTPRGWGWGAPHRWRFIEALADYMFNSFPKENKAKARMLPPSYPPPLPPPPHLLAVSSSVIIIAIIIVVVVVVVVVAFF